MMQEIADQAETDAVAWLIRLRGAGAEEWQEFTCWLEADPAHAEAFDHVALVDEELASIGPKRTSVAAYGAVARAPRRSAPFVWASAAAAVLAALGYISTRPPEAALYAVATDSASHRVVSLADGSRIELNRDTKVVLDRSNPRFARIENGEALFTVVHDEARPFEVFAGDKVIRDAGTVFNVVHEAEALEVGVAEGAVLINPARDRVELKPGMVMRVSGQAATIRRSEPSSIGGWRQGQLTYSAARLTQVAGDIGRNLGVPVRVSADLAERQFSGVIILDSEPERFFKRISPLLQVSARRTNEGWVLSAAP